jgi:2-phosphosulfolactate phosphatase
MQIDVIPTINEARTEDLAGKTVLVIDVFRSTSCIVTALHNGAESVLPVETVTEARDSQRQGDLLAGERYGKKLPGFDLGNSPLEFQAERIYGKRIVMTTTNGTRALHKSQKAARVAAASLMNARASAYYALETQKDVAILCSGTQDVYSLEDGLCAGLLIDELLHAGGESAGINDFGLSQHGAYLQAKSRLTEVLRTCSNGRKLIRAGLEADLLHCARVNTVSLVPVMQEGILTAQTLPGISQSPF